MTEIERLIQLDSTSHTYSAHPALSALAAEGFMNDAKLGQLFAGIRSEAPRPAALGPVSPSAANVEKRRRKVATSPILDHAHSCRRSEGQGADGSRSPDAQSLDVVGCGAPTGLEGLVAAEEVVDLQILANALLDAHSPQDDSESANSGRAEGMIEGLLE